MIQTWLGSAVYATFEKGEMHGPCFAFGVVPILDMDRKRGYVINAKKKDVNNLFGTAGIAFYGQMLNGQVDGTFWAGMLQRSHLVGVASPDGKQKLDFHILIYVHFSFLCQIPIAEKSKSWTMIWKLIYISKF